MDAGSSFARFRTNPGRVAERTWAGGRDLREGVAGGPPGRVGRHAFMRRSDGMLRNDLSSLMQFLLSFAQLMLREEQTFHPFAAGMTADGQMTSAYESETEPPSSVQEL